MGQLEAQLKTTVHLAGLNDEFRPLFRSSIPTCSVRSNPLNMYSVITHLVVLNGVLLRWKLGWSGYNLLNCSETHRENSITKTQQVYRFCISMCRLCLVYIFCIIVYFPLKVLLCENFFFGQCPFSQSLLCWYNTPSYSTPLSFLSLSLGETEFCRWCKGPAQQGRCVMMMILIIIIIILWCHRRVIPEPGVLNQGLWRMREEIEGGEGGRKGGREGGEGGKIFLAGNALLKSNCP